MLRQQRILTSFKSVPASEAASLGKFTFSSASKFTTHAVAVLAFYDTPPPVHTHTDLHTSIHTQTYTEERYVINTQTHSRTQHTYTQHRYKHTNSHACMHTQRNACIHTHINMHTPILYRSTHAHTHAYTQISTHIHACMHTHTSTDTNTDTQTVIFKAQTITPHSSKGNKTRKPRAEEVLDLIS